MLTDQPTPASSPFSPPLSDFYKDLSNLSQSSSFLTQEAGFTCDNNLLKLQYRKAIQGKALGKGSNFSTAAFDFSALSH